MSPTFFIPNILFTAAVCYKDMAFTSICFFQLTSNEFIAEKALENAHIKRWVSNFFYIKNNFPDLVLCLKLTITFKINQFYIQNELVVIAEKNFHYLCVVKSFKIHGYRFIFVLASKMGRIKNWWHIITLIKG